jgi:hypothetical protein
MKKRILVALCFVVLGGCSSTIPASFNNNPVVPVNGSTFTYSYSGTSPAVQLTEHVTIVDTTNSEFFADLLSDTIDGFSTTSNSQVLVLSDSDIRILSDDTLTLPIATHTSYTESPVSIPVRLNGEVGTGTIFSHSDYLGEGTINAVGQSFSCSEVSRTDSVLLNFPNNDSLNEESLNVTTFWYSATLSYFLKEQEERSLNGGSSSVVFTRILTAYKLGK